MAAIRASDAEREVVATRLRVAAGEGRLEPDELEERLGAAFSARTRAQLAPLVADLPRRGERRWEMTRRRPVRGRGVVRGQLAAYVAGNATLIAVWMAEVGARDPMLGESEFFWPIFPMVAWAAVLLRKRRSRRPRLPAP